MRALRRLDVRAEREFPFLKADMGSVPEACGTERRVQTGTAHLVRVATQAAVAATFMLTACGRPSEEVSAAESTARVGIAAAPTFADTSRPLPAGAERATLDVKGMACESCERTIAVMLRRTPGVHSALVSVERSEAVVTFDPARTTPAALVAVIKQLGYRATTRGA